MSNSWNKLQIWLVLQLFGGSCLLAGIHSYFFEQYSVSNTNRLLLIIFGITFLCYGGYKYRRCRISGKTEEEIIKYDKKIYFLLFLIFVSVFMFMMWLKINS